MAVKNSGQKKKRTPKKRKPKVKLDNRKVMALAGAIVFLCALLFSLSVVFSSGSTKKSAGSRNEKVAVEKKSDSKKSSAAKKVQSKKEGKAADKNSVATKNTAAESTEYKKPETKKTEVKKPEPKKTETAASQKNAENKEPAKPSRKNTETAEKAKPVEKVPAKKNEAKPAETAAKKTEQKVEQKKPEPVGADVPKSAAKFNIPQSSNGARLCFIIDDGGHTTANIRRYTTLPFPITIAVLPKLSATKESARIVVSDGKELMLHQPMQAQNLKMNPGPGAIKEDMGLSEIYALVMENLSELGPGVKGLNNHEGSLITCDEMKIGTVLDVAMEKGVYFVDSRTSKDTKAPMAALERDMKILEREVFIDDIIDREEMLKQILRGIGIANKKGKVIMIGHVDKSAKILPQLLSEMYPELKEKGYRIVFPSQLL